MPAERIFVGRKAELEQFKKILEEPQGQAVLVVGQAGMGKTWLINKMAELAENHLNLKCGWVRYEVTPTDSVDSTMALMMDNAFEAAQVEEGSWDGTKRRLEQWRSLLNVINVGDLVMSLRRDPQRNTREQFLERLRLLSKRMPQNGRAIFIIDPEKYMQKESDQAWAIVVKDLPGKIKFVFAQRPEDELVRGNAFKGFENVTSIPEGILGILGDQDVDDLVRFRAGDVGQSEELLRDAVRRYKGHPYAIVGALDIVKKTKSVKGLPQDPTPGAIAEAQWQRICATGDDAIKLFEAHAILEVGVPDDVVEAVSSLNTTARKRLQKDSYLRGLLREEGYGKRIYHVILADYVHEQIGDAEEKKYHSRAVKLYRRELAQAKKQQTKPDALAATRLAEHVLAVEGEEAFVDAFINECTPPLLNLGLFDTAIPLSERALGYVQKGSSGEASVLGNLGLIHKMRGDLHKAEQMFTEALDIHDKLGNEQGIAEDHGNLGLIYQKRGSLDKAEHMHLKSLEIAKKLGLQGLMASQYGNLGLACQARGDLEKAEQMFKESLEISEPAEMMELTANQCANLGLLYHKRADLDKAEQMLRKALGMYEKLGRLGGMAIQYGNLGMVYASRGDLDKAEQMFHDGLTIDEKLGRLEGMGANYANLGLVYRQRGDFDKAREYGEKALGLYQRIGMKPETEKVHGWIDKLDKS